MSVIPPRPLRSFRDRTARIDFDHAAIFWRYIVRRSDGRQTRHCCFWLAAKRAKLWVDSR